MTANVFNAAASPSQIPHHDGMTHLMFAPEADADPKIVVRWNGLRAAIGMAGGHTQAITGQFNYNYARDLFVVVDNVAFHPTIPHQRGQDYIDYRRRNLIPFITHYDYRPCGLDVLPDYPMDGGNFIQLRHHNLLLTGTHSIYDDMGDLNADQLRAQLRVASQMDLRHRALSTTTWHIDSVAGELPDGRVLIKLDETDFEHDLRAAGINEAYLVGTGVRRDRVRWLARDIGRENIITFSIYEHPESDIVCGVDHIRTSQMAARSFGLAANGIVVNGTWIGEDMPPPLAERLRADGIRMIGPRDAGVDTFVYGDEGFVGAARCLTLPVSHQPPRRGLYL